MTEELNRLGDRRAAEGAMEYLEREEAHEAPDDADAAEPSSEEEP